jgi:hypothetical protein
VTIRNMQTGEIIKAEFEYNSSSFYAHRHDPAKCDLIICWLHDWKDCVMPVWELSDPNWAAMAYVNKMDEKDRQIMKLLVDVAYWKSKAREGGTAKKVKRAINRVPDTDLMSFLQENPGASQNHIASHFGVSRQAIGQRVKKLYEVKQ